MKPERKYFSINEDNARTSHNMMSFFDYRVVENTEAMRYQVFFDGKPDVGIRDILKSNGFKWAPSQGAWQRQITQNGKYALGVVVAKLRELEGVTA